MVNKVDQNIRVQTGCAQSMLIDDRSFLTLKCGTMYSAVVATTTVGICNLVFNVCVKLKMAVDARLWEFCTSQECILAMMTRVGRSLSPCMWRHALGPIPQRALDLTHTLAARQSVDTRGRLCDETGTKPLLIRDHLGNGLRR